MARATAVRGGRPNPEQRAFVAAATAVGLPKALICELLPGGKGLRPPLTPTSLERHFPQELEPGSSLTTRLITLRVLQRALSGSDREALSAQMAVFKSLADWRRLSEGEETNRIAVEKLTRSERATLRRLLEKATDTDGEI